MSGWKEAASSFPPEVPVDDQVVALVRLPVGVTALYEISKALDQHLGPDLVIRTDTGLGGWCVISKPQPGDQGQTGGMTSDQARADYSDVRPGDRLIFERPDGVVYGGAVWQSPSTGDVLAGDTLLTLRGAWLPASTAADLSVIIDSTNRRTGETWDPVPKSSSSDPS